jgi:uncharacterized protein
VDWHTVQVLVVVFVATLIRSAFGFGEALVAVPLLAMLMPFKVAVPLAGLLSITVAAVAVVQDWHQIHLRSAGWLILSTLLGIPLGLLLLITVAEAGLKSALGVGIIAFSSYCLFNRRQAELKNDNLAWLFGFAAGVLGGAFGMNGPPLVIYGDLRRWSPVQFRATLQGYFLPASLISMCGWSVAELWVADVTSFYLLSLPLALLAIVLGRAVNQRLDRRRFLRLVHGSLIVLGTVLVLQAVLQ